MAINGCPAAQSLLPSEERRWQFLWLRSLEFLLILENSDRVVCPRHTGKTHSDLEPRVSKRNRRSEEAEDVEVEDYAGFETENCGSVSDSELIPAELPPTTVNELAAAAAMRNRRIQTMGCGPDAYYTPLAGLTRQHLHSKVPFEIVHKDIGYSSDADMSDVGPDNGATTNKCSNGNVKANSNRLVQSNSSDHVNTVGAASSGACSRSSRKRSVRRRRTNQHQRTSVRRPWSFHDGWTDWDYYQPPSYSTVCAQFKSSESLTTSAMSSPLDGPPDEFTLRSLTEFGENYEFWFKNEDDAIIRASTPVRSDCGDQTYNVMKTDSTTNTTIDEEVCHVACESTSTLASPAPSVTSFGVQCEDLVSSVTMAAPAETKEIKQRSRSRRPYFLYVTLTILTLFLSTLLGGGFTPHIQKIYPHRVPPC